MVAINNKQKALLLKLCIHLMALLPLINVYYQAIVVQVFVDPVKTVIHFTGIGAFNLLLVTLLISPLAQYFKQGVLMQTRRLLGLYSFLYALLHLLNFIAFDLQFDFGLLVNEIIKRPYITLGMLAFILLSLLAVTSFNYIRRRLGRRWQSLHNSIYLVVILVAIHFYWSVKSDITEPSIYIIFSLLLLSLRYKKFSLFKG